jgi:predicted mannosyl-3-phosphoglycerate phosphatase (HAD superfamily)
VNLLSPRTVVFCAIDDLIPITGGALSGFADFLDGLSEARIPSVWISSRNRHQLDTPIRKLGHAAPFIAENGCGVYLPEDYFHLKPERTVRLGRFTCIPVATPQPAAAQALDSLAEDTGISIVPLRGLSPRETMQNTGLARQEADALRQRDFDELFFFAGTSDADIQKFRQCAIERKLSVRPYDSLYSLAVGASLAKCVQELRKLYDRALHARAFAIALSTASESAELTKACDRTILLTDRTTSDASTDAPTAGRASPKRLPLFSAETWPQALEAIQSRQF